MNKINVKGLIRNIQPSHVIKDIEYNKADLIVTRKDGKEDVLNLRFKKFSNPYKDNQEISILGNVRSYSKQLENGKNKVELYIFTYFDNGELDENDQEIINEFIIDGRICKIEVIRLDEIYNVIDYLTTIINKSALLQIGVQSAPGLLMCINGEEIRVGRSGLYEILNGYKVTFIGFIVEPNDNKHFMLDYQY